MQSRRAGEGGEETEHNHASRRVADKLGLTLQQRGPDAGNPDPAAVRLVYADRSLTPEQRAATLA
ncbi:hypothetical protein ACTHQ1_07875 [Janibacter anophelis]|uniref:hypothetical protein n=1 Tax=Janibacter anophelis TaxID=319054 RepID=UPI003F7E5A38